ncbi:MAG: xanthine dehydrogenase family protein [Rhodospirillaceae bacterium]|nr:xanthine dehydrogenase family protein [Rhodospirillaceae bacterium]
MKFGMGQSVPRYEDPRLLRGGGRYTDDHVAPNMARAYFLRSPHAHAQIASIDTQAAAKMPGVLAIYTGEDVAAAGLGNLPCMPIEMFPLKRLDGSPAFHPPRPAITRDRVRHVGDIVAMVVGETVNAAKDAAEAIEIEYEELPSVTDTAAAVAKGAPKVWDQCPDNVAFVQRIGDPAAVDAAFARADHVVAYEWRNTRVSQHWMEPRAALGIHDRFDDRYTLISGSQGPHDLRRLLAHYILKIPEMKLRVLSPDMGGGFGGRSNSYPEMALVLWAAKLLGRPVKWNGERSEAFLSDDQGRDTFNKVELALDRDGIFLGLRVKTVATVGAYMSVFGPWPAFANAGGLAGVYRTPAIFTEVLCTVTNTPTIGPYRGAGRPEASFSIEMAIDLAARKLGMDRVELRRKNMIPTGQFPWKTPLTYVYDCGEFEAVMDKTIAHADVAGFGARKQESERKGKLRGLGIACTIEQSAGGFDESCELRVDPSGGVTLLIGTHSHGQGHETVFRQLLADRLGLDFDQVRIVQGDSDAVPQGHGSFGSRSSGLGGAVIKLASERVLEKAKQIAAHNLEAAAEDIEFKAGKFAVAGTDRAIAWNDVARLSFAARMLPPGMETGLGAKASFTPPAPTFPNGCHICEVEIEPETGITRIDRYTVVDDVGTVMNPLLLKGQIHGGIVQGIGQILLENFQFDRDSGQVLTGSLMDYALPRADDVPRMEVSSHPVPSPTNPLGIKGAGEAGTVGAMPCVHSAIMDALAPLGIEWLDMPASPHRVWAAIAAARAKRAA